MHEIDDAFRPSGDAVVGGLSASMRRNECVMLQYDEEELDLSEQTVLITGGGRRLGRAFAMALAHAGVRVAITARSDHGKRCHVS